MTGDAKQTGSLTSTSHQRLAVILLALVGVAAMVFVGVAVGKPLLDSLQDPAAFQTWIEGQGVFAPLAFIGLMAMQIIIAWLPGEPLEIGAGYAFGFWEGSLLCMAGILLGSTLVFCLVRRFGRRLVTLFFSAEKLDSVVLFKDTRRLTLLGFILFMIPGTPKDILTYCAGLTPMKFSSWLLITGVARIPPVITSTLGGSALGEGQYALVIAIFGVTAVLSILGLLLYRRMGRTTQEEKQA